MAIVVPCYNEEAVLPKMATVFLDTLADLTRKGKIGQGSHMLFVDDGSADATWKIISDLAHTKANVRGLRLSRNRGHQHALLAGLLEARNFCDITISADCDGQDDLAAMEEMVDEWHKGAEIVYGVRSNRKTDTFFKRFTAESFYRVMNALTGGNIVYNHADYRLVSARALNEFASFHEVNLFLRGLFPLVGFKSACVYYERKKRVAGTSHYPLAKMLALAVDGITSLSIRPIRIVTAVGTTISLISFAGIIWTLITRFAGASVSGWASLFCALCLLGGIQLISLGVIGEYVGKAYMETKARPRFIISERTYTASTTAHSAGTEEKYVDIEKS